MTVLLGLGGSVGSVVEEGRCWLHCEIGGINWYFTELLRLSTDYYELLAKLRRVVLVKTVWYILLVNVTRYYSLRPINECGCSECEVAPKDGEIFRIWSNWSYIVEARRQNYKVLKGTRGCNCWLVYKEGIQGTVEEFQWVYNSSRPGKWPFLLSSTSAMPL
jgi:hypothetical protein